MTKFTMNRALDGDIQRSNDKVALKDLAKQSDVKSMQDAFNVNSKNGNGYTKLPNGLILQWGADYSAGIVSAEYSKTKNFTMTFPNSCLCVVCCLDDPGYGTNALLGGVGVKSYTKTGFTFIFKKNQSYATNLYVRFIAIGY